MGYSPQIRSDGDRRPVCNLRGKTMYLKLAAIALTAISLSACQTAKRGSTSTVKVYVTPSTANIKTSLGDTCKSPCTLKVKRRKAFTITASKPGYKSKTVAVKRVVNKKAARRTAASFVVPGGSALVAVDTISGAFYDHKPNPVHIRLKRR